MPVDSSLAWVPDAESLATGLRSAFGATSNSEFRFNIVKRKPSVYASSFPAEVVTVLLGDGSTVELLCKYGVGHVETGFGHRGGVPYESRVYRDLLTPLRVSAPKYWGEYWHPDSGSAWLFIEFLSGAARLHRTSDPSNWLVEAARWIGNLHRCCRDFPSHSVAFLPRYTPEYFSGWAERTVAFTHDWHESAPWLPELCKNYSARGGMLAASEPTVIHGEYYPNNILIDLDSVRPVDWESAAVGPGEIDLASLTEGNWPSSVVEACIDVYVNARWPDGAPIDFEATLAAARLYLHLRWLGDNEARTLSLVRTTGVSTVRELGEELGLI